ncbi:MAG: orotate phosphoribosyltransferase [Candidatus Kapabacteria bacterium]|nr:orotate phosphoribosyltransferase [Candidatus Kapabacteria bacterium]
MKSEICPMTKPQLIAAIYDVAHITGEFKLRSGIISNEYFDKYQFESDPKLLQAIAAELVPLIPPGTEMLAGLEMGGLAIATALSIASGLPVVFVRKKAKDYGTCKLAEGPDISGKRLLIVEDVITSGGQVIISGNDLRSLGAHADDVLCVIDREQGGRAKLEEAGYRLTSLCTMTDLKAGR